MFLSDSENFAWCLTIFRIQCISLRMAMTNRELEDCTFALCLWMSQWYEGENTHPSCPRGGRYLWSALHIPCTKIFWKKPKHNVLSSITQVLWYQTMYPWGCLLSLENSTTLLDHISQLLVCKIIIVDGLLFQKLKIFQLYWVIIDM